MHIVWLSILVSVEFLVDKEALFLQVASVGNVTNLNTNLSIVTLSGKWILQQLGNNHTLLKYSIDSKLHRDTFLSQATVEEDVYEVLPSNLCAIRNFVEKEEALKTKNLSTKLNSDSPIPHNEKKCII